MKLDRYDQQILEILQTDGRINNQDLADRIGLSPSPCLRRVRALDPDLLVTGALHDPRVMVREPAKWVASLLDSDPGWSPRCLRTPSRCRPWRSAPTGSTW